MGCFSWECKCCGESAKEGDDWMGQVVIVGEDGSVLRGTYDGYGRVHGGLGSIDISDGPDSFALYHSACYKLAGKPDYDGPSRHADDQGLGESEIEPRTLEDVEAIKTRRKARDAEQKARWEASKVQIRAEYEAKGEPVPEWLM